MRFAGFSKNSLLFFNKKILNLTGFVVNIGARDENRTHTGQTYTPLKRTRLPVPPLAQDLYNKKRYQKNQQENDAFIKS